MTAMAADAPQLEAGQCTAQDGVQGARVLVNALQPISDLLHIIPLCHPCSFSTLVQPLEPDSATPLCHKSCM